MTPAILLGASLLYLVALAAVRIRPARLGWLNRPQLLASSLAIVASVLALWIVAISPFWTRSTEIAWTGLEAEAAGNDLQVGAGATSAIGWPNGAFSPTVRIVGATPGAIDVTGGAGFVKHPDGSVVNGTPIPRSVPVTVRAFTIQTERSWLFWKTFIVVRDTANLELGRFPVRTPGRDRVIDLGLAVAPDASRLRSANQGARATALERWASGLRLLVPATGDIRILDPDAPSSHAVVPLGANVTVHWASGSLSFQIQQGDSRQVMMYFPPPWRLASPLPERSNDGRSQIVVTSQLMPGDTALLLPFGQSLSGFRRLLPMVNDRFADCTDTAERNPFAPRAPVADLPDLEGITCDQRVPTGQGAIHLATVRDLPRWSDGIWMLTIASAAFCLGLFVTSTRMRRDDLWVVCGLAMTVWLVLVYRLHLALRYAADSAYLDPLSVRGVAVAMIALTVVPNVVLLVAPLWRDQYATFKAGERPFVPLALLGAVLSLASVAQVVVVGRLWPNLPERYLPVNGLGGLLQCLIVAGFAFSAFIGFLAFHYFLDPARLPLTPWLKRALIVLRGFSLACWYLLRTTATVPGRTLWEAVAHSSRQRPSGGGPVTLVLATTTAAAKGFWWWYAALTAVAVVLLLLISAIVYFDITGTAKYVQSIVAPVVFCWIPAVLLLSARRVFGVAGGPSVNPLHAVVVIVTIMAIGILVFPIAVQDVGGIVDTVSIMLAVALLLVVGRRHWPISAVPVVMFIAVGLLAIAAYARINVVVNPLSRLGQTASARLLVWRHGIDAQSFMPGRS
jgi:hypothetical protein